jgi:glycosyltransferase involved in cell wall biosynthesis
MKRPKRIAVCTAQVPFCRGGAEILVETLAHELSKRDWPVEIVRIPFQWEPKEEILKGYLAWQLLDLTMSNSQPIDVVIATKFPSYAVRHPHKVTWLIQQFRQIYDLFGTPYSDFTASPEHERLRQLIRQVDTRTLAESRRLFAISRNVAQRVARYNGLDAEPLYPPPRYDGLYRNDGYGDYLLSVSRLDTWKRVHLVIQAMARVRSGARLLIVGEGPDQKRLQQIAEEHSVLDRVEFLGHAGDARLLELYANCFAVYYGPVDEDYGLATVEAFKSQKPVITTHDAGGVLEFVQDGHNGYVVQFGDQAQLADRIDHLHRDRSSCRRMGEVGFETERSITWDATIPRLLEG